jgi:hypothetical protein
MAEAGACTTGSELDTAGAEAVACEDSSATKGTFVKMSRRKSGGVSSANSSLIDLVKRS